MSTLLAHANAFVTRLVSASCVSIDCVFIPHKWWISVGDGPRISLIHHLEYTINKRIVDVLTNFVRMTYWCVFVGNRLINMNDDDDEDEYSPTLCQLLKVLGSLYSVGQLCHDWALHTLENDSFSFSFLSFSRGSGKRVSQIYSTVKLKGLKVCKFLDL